MKRFLTLILAIVPLLAMAQDDLYFTPAKKAKVKKEQPTTSMAAKATTVEKAATVDYNSCSRDEDDYNRRYSFGGANQNAGGAYADYASDDSLNYRIDTVYVTDYDLNDPSLEYRYSRRLLRFHTPHNYSLIRNPYYWDLVYGYGAYDYLYDWYDPWYWSYGWGYGWSWGPWDCWYGGIWGYHHLHHWSYWGWGPNWGYYHGIGGSLHGYHNTAAINYRPRGTYARTENRFNGDRIRTNPGLNNRTRTVGGGRADGILAQSVNRTNPSRSSAVRSSASAGGYRGTIDGGSSRNRMGTINSRMDRSSSMSNRTAAPRYGERGSATVDSRSTATRSSAAASSRNNSSTRSYSNSSSSSRSSSYSTSSSRSSSYSGSSSSSFGGGGGARSGGGGFSGGGGGGVSRGGGGGRR